MIRFEQEDDGEKGRFVIYENDVFAGEMTYTWSGESKFIIDHTGVDKVFSGKGYGKRLIVKAIEFARNKGLKILPLCPFVKKVFDADNSLNDLRF